MSLFVSRPLGALVEVADALVVFKLWELQRWVVELGGSLRSVVADGTVPDDDAVIGRRLGVGPRREATMAAVTFPAAPAVVHSVPIGAGFSVLLLLHVACAIVGFGAVAVTGVEARRAGRPPTGPGADGVRRYFSPGVNWAARALYG